MPDLALEQKFLIKLTSKELRLISRGLRDTLTPEDLESALELQKEILVQRHVLYKQMLHESQKFIDNLEADE